MKDFKESCSFHIQNDMLRTTISVFLILLNLPFFNSLSQASVTPFRADPDRVLVLYNADWSKDVDGSEPGQDSMEVAKYYVGMHSDPVTGKKPYFLGLKCVHGEKHLNHWFIREKSQDNKNGIVFMGRGKGPAAKEWARDSRHVEIVLDSQKEQVDWDSVRIWCQSAHTQEKKLVTPIISGLPIRKGRKYSYPEIQEGKGRCYRKNAHQLFKGTVWILFKAKNRSGNVVRDLKLKYYDRDDFKFSILGRDGISDEQHFQEDVAIPVKEFLEDPNNALPDGTLLKNHILYIVICHGLPFSCEGVFGAERGVDSNPGNHGDLGSLEQRLQTLYYDWGGRIVPPVISMFMSRGPDARHGVRNYRITTGMRYSQHGRSWNPFMHPDTYSFLRKEKQIRFIDIPPFPEQRAKAPPFFFAYGVSRIDGKGPREAKRLIDYALYASKFLRPEIDRLVREDLRKANKDKIEGLPERLKKAEHRNKWGSEEQRCLGFRVLSSRKRRQGILQGIPFLGRPIEDAHIPVPKSKGKKDEGYLGYYPGGMDFTVHSSNGWNKGVSSPIWEQVDRGVTVSACGGPAYGGGPHITNATFWDNLVLTRYLFRGRDLGECFLRSTIYVNWSTSLLGDPLLHPDLSKTVLDDAPPAVDSKESIKVSLIPAMGKYAGKMTIPLISTANNPEVAELTIFYRKKGEKKDLISRWPIYSTRPGVVLRNLEPDTTYVYRPLLTDPYGNRTDLVTVFGNLSFRTGPRYDTRRSVRSVEKKNEGWAIDSSKLEESSEHGTIEIEFIAGENGFMPSIRSKNLSFDIKRWRKGVITGIMQMGGPSKKWRQKSALQKGEKATLVLRWRRFPLTREALLRAKDGAEFTLAADIRTPWQAMKLRVPISIKETRQVQVLSVKIIDDANPASSGACKIMVPSFDNAAWKRSNG